MASLGTNTKFAYSTNLTTPIWSVLPEMTEVNPPAVEVEDVQGTYYGITRRIFKPGLKKLSDMSVTLFYNPDDTPTQTLITNTGNVLLFGLSIKEPDDKWTWFKFTGFVTKYEIKTPMDGNMEITFSIKPDGVTWELTQNATTDPFA